MTVSVDLTGHYTGIYDKPYDLYHNNQYLTGSGFLAIFYRGIIKWQ